MEDRASLHLGLWGSEQHEPTWRPSLQAKGAGGTGAAERAQGPPKQALDLGISVILLCLS